MPEERMRVKKTELPRLDRPPFCFVPSGAIIMASGIVMIMDHQMVPMIINVFIGTILGYLMGRLYAWADIAYITAVAAAAREQSWIRTAANFMYPVIWDKSYAIRTLVVVAIVIVGMSGSALALSGAYRVFPNASIPWAQFQGVSFDHVLINNISRTIFVYLTAVIWTVTIIEYRWFMNLED